LSGPPLAGTALWFEAPRRLAFRREPLVEPGPGEVLVRALRSGISHGTEMLVYRGQVDPGLALDLPTLSGGFGFPIKYGYASVGRVEARGAEVQSVQVGDLVFCLHPHQDVYVAPISLVTRLPGDLDPELGVFMANLTTALTIVLDAAPRLGEVVALFGLGTVGQLVAQLLRRSGAEVVAIDPIERRRRLALALGAAHAAEPGLDAASAVEAVSDGRGADLAVDISGAPAALQQAIDLVAPEGAVVVASWYGTKTVPLQLGERFHRGRLRLRSSQVGGLEPSLAPRWNRRRRDELAVRLLGELPLRPLISHRVPFASAGSLYRLLDERPAEAVQAVLVYD
jgi:2-desacetyl-2-hydroxyethyl bacteriochlorophyllide A dehydrogenase